MRLSAIKRHISQENSIGVSGRFAYEVCSLGGQDLAANCCTFGIEPAGIISEMFI